MKKIFVLLMIMIICPLCADAYSMKETMNEIMDSWIGLSLDELIDHWGYPKYDRVIAGKQAYIWRNEYTIVSYGYGTSNGQIAFCERSVEVDDQYNIVKTRWIGSQCPYNYYDGRYKSWVHPDKSYYKLKEELKRKKEIEKQAKKAAKKAAKEVQKQNK